MSDLNIDRLSIEIEANSNQASKQIDKLSSSLNNLKTATTGFKLTSVSNQINKLAVATSSLNNAQFSNISKNIGILSNAFNGLKNIGTIDKTVTSTINSLTKLNGITNSLKGDKLVIFANQMKQVASAIQPLTELGKSNLGGALNQLKKLPETVQILEKVDMQKFTTQMKSLAKAIEPVAKQSQKMSTVFSRFPLLVKSAGNQFTSFNAKLNKTNKASSSLSATLGILRSKFIAIQFAGSIFTTAFTSAFEESSAYIENLNLFNVAMGECTASALQFAQSVQDAMGIDISEWLRYQGAFNMMITGFGVSSDKAQIMSQNLTQLAYDYSSLMNIDVESAFDKLNSAMSGQIKGLKAFGNNVSVAMVKETGLKYGLDGAVASWDQNTQAIMRYITIVNNASNVDVFNDMARTIATPANAVRILTQQFTMLKRAIGNIASVIASAVIPYIQIAVQLLTQLASWFANLLGFKLPEIDYSGIAGGGADAEDSLDSVGDSADSTADKVKELKKQLMGFDELNIINKPTEDTNSGGSGSGGAGGGSVGDIELPQYDFLKGLEAKTNETLDRITKKMADFFKPVSDSWDKYGNQVMNSFKVSWNETGKLISDVGKSIDEVWKNGTGTITFDSIFKIITNINIAVGNIARNFSSAWNEAETGTKIIQNIWDMLNIGLGTIEEISREFRNFTSKLNFSPLLKSVENLTGSLKDFSIVVSKYIKDAYKNVLEPLAKWTIEKAVPSIVNSVSKALKGFSKILDTLKPAITILEKVATGLLKIGGNAILKAIDLVASAVDGLGSLFKEYPNLMKGVTVAVTTFLAVWKIDTFINTNSALKNLTTSFGGLSSVVSSVKNLGFTTALSGWMQQISGTEGTLTTMIGTFSKLSSALTGAVSSAFTSLSTKMSDVASNGGALSGVASGLGSIFSFLASNPMVAVVAGLTAITVGVVAVMNSMDNSSSKYSALTEESKTLAEESKKLSETQKELNEIASKDMGSQLGKYAVIKQYYQELVDLGQGNVTEIGNATQKVDELNSYCGQTVVEIENGKLKWQENTGEVYKNIEAMKIRAMISANESAYGEALLQSDTIMSKLTVSEQNLTQAQSDFNQKVQEYVDKGMTYSEAQLQATRNNGDLLTTIDGLKTSYNDTALAMINNQKTLDVQSALELQAQAQTDANSVSVKDLASAYMNLTGEYDNQLTKSGEVTLSWDSLSNKLVDYNEVMAGHGDKFKQMTDIEKQNAEESKNVVLQKMAEKAIGSEMSLEQMKTSLGKSWTSMTKAEQEELTKQYTNIVNSGTSEQAENLRQRKKLETLINDSNNNVTELKKSELRKSLEIAQQNGSQSGKTFIDNLEEEYKNGKTKTDKATKDIGETGKKNIEDAKAEIQVKADEAYKKFDEINKFKLGNKSVSVGVNFKAKQTTIKIGEAVQKIELMANGGFANAGEMFIAREAGPELVGRIGKKSAVANNDQIIGGISAGVYNAVKNAMGSVGGNSGNIVVHAHVEIEKKEIGKASVEYNNGIVKQTGKSPLLV